MLEPLKLLDDNLRVEGFEELCVHVQCTKDEKWFFATSPDEAALFIVADTVHGLASELYKTLILTRVLKRVFERIEIERRLIRDMGLDAEDIVVKAKAGICAANQMGDSTAAYVIQKMMPIY